ncbi:MotA/TolQ/ExbB proton channel family protein [Spirulina sp. 06S082]|nr:MotA/TolQ/ExbB proton channel family protein [Spirulina sp. 06S082]MEA5468543.1 MotA/TolQ/ExbB proton channel family protein [Spirulina sp. 06S082]
MYPLLLLSIFTFACALDRGRFWVRLLIQEDRVTRDVLETARVNLSKAADIAKGASYLPIGRFLLAPLQLRNPSPETFRLAMEAAGDKEFVKMQKGEKFLETTVAVAPLLGLLGTVTGLIRTFENLNIGSENALDASNAAAGIGEALITTAAGMIVAIFALLVFRVMVTLQAQQMDYFSEVGTELELIYRQVWYEPTLQQIKPSLLPFVEEGDR